MGNTELYTDLNYNDRDDYENRYRQRIKDLDEGEGAKRLRDKLKQDCQVMNMEDWKTKAFPINLVEQVF